MVVVAFFENRGVAIYHGVNSTKGGSAAVIMISYRYIDVILLSLQVYQGVITE